LHTVLLSTVIAFLLLTTIRRRVVIGLLVASLCALVVVVHLVLLLLAIALVVVLRLVVVAELAILRGHPTGSVVWGDATLPATTGETAAAQSEQEKEADSHDKDDPTAP
jgi:hypothetical protein